MQIPDDPDRTRPHIPLERLNGAATGIYATTAGIVAAGKAIRDHWRETHTFTVAVTANDPIYQDVQDWLLLAVPIDRQRALAVHTDRRHSDGYLDVDRPPSRDEEAQRARLLLTYDSAQEQTITVDGFPVRFFLSRPDPARDNGRTPDKIVFRCRSRAGQQAVVGRLQEIGRTRTARRPQLWLLSNWGTWQRRADIPPRTTDSVILPAGQMERLVDDVGTFLAREADYGRLGIPWHRGVLLQGPPGTGKTSIAKALANHFGLDLWYVPLGDLSKDANLLALLADVHPRSMLLLEDFDGYQAATTRDAQPGQLTLSGLLNALDGVSTPHGLITVLTTNTLTSDTLDEALIRPGRIDRVEHVGYATDEQAHRLFTAFYGHPPRQPWSVGPNTSTAMLTEVFKRHMDDPDTAEDTLAATARDLVS